MKQLLTSLLLLIAISITAEAQTDQINSKTELLIELMGEITQSDYTKSVSVGNDSKGFPILMDGQVFYAIAVGPQDAAAGQMSVENFGSIQVKLNAIALNKTMGRQAKAEEILNILNWQTVKGFRWDSQMQINRLPESYDVTEVSLYGISGVSHQTLARVMSDLIVNELKVANFATRTIDSQGLEVEMTTMDDRVVILIQTKVKVVLRLYKGDVSRSYDEISLTPRDSVYYLDLNVPGMNIYSGTVEVEVREGIMHLTHIGEKIK